MPGGGSNSLILVWRLNHPIQRVIASTANHPLQQSEAGGLHLPIAGSGLVSSRSSSDLIPSTARPPARQRLLRFPIQLRHSVAPCHPACLLALISPPPRSVLSLPAPGCLFPATGVLLGGVRYRVPPACTNVQPQVARPLTRRKGCTGLLELDVAVLERLGATLCILRMVRASCAGAGACCVSNASEGLDTRFRQARVPCRVAGDRARDKRVFPVVVQETGLERGRTMRVRISVQRRPSSCTNPTSVFSSCLLHALAPFSSPSSPPPRTQCSTPTCAPSGWPHSKQPPGGTFNTDIGVVRERGGAAANRMSKERGHAWRGHIDGEDLALDLVPEGSRIIREKVFFLVLPISGS